MTDLAREVGAAQKFGQTPDGQQVHRVSIGNGRLTAHLVTYGAALQDLRLQGHTPPLVLGWPTLDGYVNSNACFGAIVGRFANRIANGRFQIDGRHYRTDRNFLGRHTLHGGVQHAGHLVWSLSDWSAQSAAMTVVMPDGHMGFPGRLEAQVRYTVSESDALEIEIEARTDRLTPCSFAPHSYFVLDDSGDVAGHDMRIMANRYLPLDGDLIPTGEVREVAGTKFDFRLIRQIGAYPYDLNYCLSRTRGNLREVCRIASAQSGLELRVATTEPGLQIYTNGQFDEVRRAGLCNMPYDRRSGIAVEPQLWPDALHHPGFPSATLAPGQTYRHVSRFGFYRVLS